VGEVESFRIISTIRKKRGREDGGGGGFILVCFVYPRGNMLKTHLQGGGEEATEGGKVQMKGLGCAFEERMVSWTCSWLKSGWEEGSVNQGSKPMIKKRLRLGSSARGGVKIRYGSASRGAASTGKGRGFIYFDLFQGTRGGGSTLGRSFWKRRRLQAQLHTWEGNICCGGGWPVKGRSRGRGKMEQVF